MIIGMQFVKYKESVTTLREVVERHFNTVMKEIMNGLPSIQGYDDDDADTDDGGDDDDGDDYDYQHYYCYE